MKTRASITVSRPTVGRTFALLICFALFFAVLLTAPSLALGEGDGNDNALQAATTESAANDTSFIAATIASKPLTAQALTAASNAVRVSDYNQLVQAINSISTSGTIALAANITYGEDATITIPKGKTVTLNLNNHTLKRDLGHDIEDGCVIHVKSGATLNLRDGAKTTGTITGGFNSGDGGGIYNEGALNIVGCNIVKNRSYGNGGGIANAANSEASLTNVFIDENTASGYGGGVYNSGGATFNVVGGRMQGNVVVPSGSNLGKGGGAYNSGTMVLRDATISKNEADCGGGVANGNVSTTDKANSSLLISNCLITLNTAEYEKSYRTGGFGGGVYAGHSSSTDSTRDSKPSLTIEKSTRITDNSSESAGGGLYIQGNAIVSLQTARILNNKSDNKANLAGGGGIYMEGETDSSSSSSKIAAGELQVSGKPIVKGNTFCGNPDNVYLVQQKLIKVADKLENGAHIEITKPEGRDNYRYDATTDYNMVMGDADPAAYFYADETRHSNEDGYPGQTVFLKDGEVRVADNVSYIDIVDGQRVEKTCYDYTHVDQTYENFPWSDGWWVVDRDTWFDQRTYTRNPDNTRQYNVNLILSDDTTFTCFNGINVAQGARLGIYGQKNMSGKLIATGHGGKPKNYWGLAGIGTQYWEQALGRIEIFGGAIYATGSGGSPGIGKASGYHGDMHEWHYYDESGILIVYDGYVEARGGDYGAGIGGGLAQFNFHTEFHGGTVKAYGGANAPGIGPGPEQLMGGWNGYVIVTGGDVTAIGGTEAPGVGAVLGPMSQETKFRSRILISGGTLRACGGTNREAVHPGTYGTCYLRGGTLETYSKLESGDGSARVWASDGYIKLGKDPDDASVALDYRVLQGSSKSDAKPVATADRETTLQTENPNNGYVAAELCTDHEFEIDKAARKATCKWCGHESPVHTITYEPGEGTGTNVTDYWVEERSYTLPTQNDVNFKHEGTHDIDSSGTKVLAGWSIDGVVYNLDEELSFNHDVTAVAQWSLDWKGLQDYINKASTDQVIWLPNDVVAGSNDTAIVVPANKWVVINLNGHQINRNMSSSAATDDGCALKVLGGLTIRDRLRKGQITGGNGTKGGGLHVANGARVALESGTISGNAATNGGGAYVAKGGTFMVSDDGVTGNTATGDGGGVYVEQGAAFTLTGDTSEVSKNSAKGSGGGVYAGGIVEMSNGDIANNTAVNQGGGVYAAKGGEFSFISDSGNLWENTAAVGGGAYVSKGSTFALAGKPNIQHNTVNDGQASNVYLQNDAVITVPQTLKPYGAIGVSVQTPPSATAQITLTSGLKGNGSYESFASENSSYLVGNTADGEAALSMPVTVSFNAGEGSGSMDAVVIPQNSTYELPVNKFTEPDGLEFVGWKIGETDEVKAAGDTARITGDTVLTAQYSKYYDIWVGSTQVTAENYQNVLDQVDASGEPTAAYIPSTNTLVLNNPTISDTRSSASIYAEDTDLLVTGAATLNGDSRGIYVYKGSLTLSGDFDIYASVYGVMANNVTIGGGSIHVTITSTDTGHGVRAWRNDDSTITIANGTQLLDISALAPLEANSIVIGDALYKEIDEEEHQRIVPFSLEGSIVWDDNNDAKGARPESVAVNVLANGDVTETLTVTKEDGWKWDLSAPYSAEGTPITYSISENPLANYTCTVDDLTVTNTYHETSDVVVDVTWDDGENRDGTRPDSLSMNLKADGKNIGTATLNDENDWSATFSNMDKFRKDGKEITYTWEPAIAPEGYEATVETVGNTSHFRYSHQYEAIRMEAKVVWADGNNRAGLRPQNLTVKLLQGSTEHGTYILSETNGWAISVTDLPQYYKGAKQNYSWTLDTSAISVGYRTDLTETDRTALFTNVIVGTTSFSVIKEWDDSDNQDGLRPASVTVRLKANGASTDSTASLNDDNSWSYAWSDLERYDNAGEEITYTVSEDRVDGYTLAATWETEGGSKLINAHSPAAKTVRLQALWVDGNDAEGARPASLDVKLQATAGGQEIAVDNAARTLDKAGSWACTWEGLPAYANGQAIEYSLAEPETPEGYRLSLAGNAASGLTISCTKLSSRSVSVTWNDGDNQDGVRPESLDMSLKLGDKTVGTATLNDANGWAGQVANLDGYNADGSRAVYTWEEPALPAGYDQTCETSGDATVFHNERTPETTSCSVSIEWDDVDDQDGLRPDSIRISLEAYIDGALDFEVGEYVLSETNNWSMTVSGLPAYKNAKPISYEWEEIEPPVGYHVPDLTDASLGAQSEHKHSTLRFKHAPATSSSSVVVAWADGGDESARPESLQATLRATAGGKEVALEDAAYALDAAGGWKAEAANLPAYADGTKVAYSWTLDTSSISGAYRTTSHVSGSATTFTNVLSGTTSFTVAKEWDDNNNSDNVRPQSITVRLLADNAPATGVQPATLSAANGWKHAWEGLPRYDATGEEIVYAATEDAVDGYALASATPVEGGIVLTNAHAPETKSLRASVSWADGNDAAGARPESLDIKLTGNANGQAINITNAERTLSAEGNWTYRWRNLPVNADEQPIEYGLATPEAPEGYRVDVSGNADVGFTVTCTKVSTRSVVVTWDDGANRDGKRPEQMEMTLKSGDKTVGTATATAEGAWTGALDGIADYDANDSRIAYTWSTDALPEGYQASCQTDGNTTYFRCQRACDTASRTIAIAWDDGDDQDGLRPNSLVAHIAAGGRTYRTVALGSTNNWTATISDLPKNENGTEIAYEWQAPNTPQGYSMQTAQDGNTTTVRFTHAPATTSSSVAVTWADGDGSARPASLQAALNATAGGKVIKLEGAAHALDAAGGWKAEVAGLPVYADGAKVSYSWKLDTSSISSAYRTTSHVSGSATTFTNTLSGTTSFTVTKEWNDDDNRDGLRPASATVHLKANGTSTGSPATLNDGNGWSYTWSDLPRYDAAGEEIAYAATEDAVDGYTLASSEPVEGGVVLTNTHAPKTKSVRVSASWSDGNDAEDARPESVALKLEATVSGTAIEMDGTTCTLNAANGWANTWENLPVFSNGEKITYTLVEPTAPEGYRVSTTGSDASGFSLAYTRLTSRAITIAWNDDGNRDGLRPDSLRPVLRANGGTVEATTVSSDGNWVVEVDDLDGYDFYGVKIPYRWAMEPPEGYELSVTDADEDPTTFTLTHKPGKSSVPVALVWDDAGDQDGMRPKSVEVSVTKPAGDSASERVCEIALSTNNAWRAKASNLTACEGGEPIAYEIEVSDIDGYKLNVAGDASSGFTITATHTPDPAITTHTITYKLNGGTFGGSSNDIVETHEKGAAIAIHAAPTRTGYQFLYWTEPQCEPGDSYVVTEDHVFTAQWKKSTPSPDAEAGPTMDDSIFGDGESNAAANDRQGIDATSDNGSDAASATASREDNATSETACNEADAAQATTGSTTGNTTRGSNSSSASSSPQTGDHLLALWPLALLALASAFVAAFAARRRKEH